MCMLPARTRKCVFSPSRCSACVTSSTHRQCCNVITPLLHTFGERRHRTRSPKYGQLPVGSLPAAVSHSNRHVCGVDAWLGHWVADRSDGVGLLHDPGFPTLCVRKAVVHTRMEARAFACASWYLPHPRWPQIRQTQSSCRQGRSTYADRCSCAATPPVQASCFGQWVHDNIGLACKVLTWCCRCCGIYPL